MTEPAVTHPVTDRLDDPGDPPGPSPSRTTELHRICDDSAADLVAWRAGNRLALERLVHRLTPMLWQIVRAYRLDEQAAEDVVQTTWLTLVRKGDTIKDPQTVVRWLTVSARREAAAVAKAAQRVESEDDVTLDLRPHDGPTVEQVVVRGHRDQALWDAVNSLPQRCQKLLRVIACGDRPDYGQLASDMGMSVGSIGPTRGRCLEKLRGLLGAAADWRI